MTDDLPEFACKRIAELIFAETARYGELPEGWSADLVRARAKHHGLIRAFVKHIAATEEEPVDPLLEEARKIVAEENPDYTKDILAGEWDKSGFLKRAKNLLRRGYEIGKAEQ